MFQTTKQLSWLSWSFETSVKFPKNLAVIHPENAGWRTQYFKGIVMDSMIRLRSINNTGENSDIFKLYAMFAVLRWIGRFMPIDFVSYVSCSKKLRGSVHEKSMMNWWTIGVPNFEVIQLRNRSKAGWKTSPSTASTGHGSETCEELERCPKSFSEKSK